MSEATIAAGLVAAIQSMTEFADADVVHNGWGLLDQTTSAAPYVIVSTADDFVSRQDTVSEKNTWQIPVILVEAFTDWATALGNLRTRRQAIIDKINSTNARSAGGLQCTIDEVRNGGPITPDYGRYVEDPSEADPIFLTQVLILTCEEY